MTDELLLIEQQIEDAKAVLSALWKKRRELLKPSKPVRPTMWARQAEMVRLLSEGKAPDDIAEQLGVKRARIGDYLHAVAYEIASADVGSYSDESYKRVIADAASIRRALVARDAWAITKAAALVAGRQF